MDWEALGPHVGWMDGFKAEEQTELLMEGNTNSKKPETKPSQISSSHLIISEHFNLSLIGLKYLNQYKFSQKSICSYKYDCLIIHKLWALRLGKISVADRKR